MSASAFALASVESTERNDPWLKAEVDTIWDRYFADTPRVNQIDAEFRRAWKRRLGVISLSHDAGTTRIGVNSLLSRPEAPYCLTLVTVAHELVHYSHGFGSPLPQKYRHPHRGGIVNRELRARGLGQALEEYSEWIHQHWWSFYTRHQRRRR